MDIHEYSHEEEIILKSLDNIRIKYGLIDNNRDVTDICRNKCINSNNQTIIIPCGDHARAAIFGDPIPYVLKSIFIHYIHKINKNNTSIGISLGLDCSSAVWAIQNGYRASKEKGYKTCPFDLMASTYEGIIECIKDDFKYFTDTDYLELVKHGEQDVIIHKKYGFVFNHESPGHAELYKKENWQFGKTHFIDNNYKLFIERYTSRIENFRNYIQSGHFIYFITTIYDTSELKKIINYCYPELRYEIIIIDYLI
jgi:hypothetical protein